MVGTEAKALLVQPLNGQHVQVPAWVRRRGQGTAAAQDYRPVAVTSAGSPGWGCSPTTRHLGLSPFDGDAPARTPDPGVDQLVAEPAVAAGHGPATNHSDVLALPVNVTLQELGTELGISGALLRISPRRGPRPGGGPDGSNGLGNVNAGSTR
jgi:hypothetical protein